MCMTGQKLQFQILQGRTGGVFQILQGRTGGVVEPVCVEDDRVENENQDDGVGPDKDMGEGG
jgi:hypothetical protein